MHTLTLSKPGYVIAEQIAHAISGTGYAVVEHFLALNQVVALASDIQQLQEEGKMQRAGIGQASNNARHVDDSVRGDFTHWLTPASSSVAQQHYFERMEDLRIALNRSLFMGLFSIESHFTVYPAGTGYAKHLDQFQGHAPKIEEVTARPQRLLSSVLYLNQHWQTQQGGQLRLYLQSDSHPPYLDIEPAAGTLVLFLSDTFFHEVLPASRERLSVTGWFSSRGEAVL